MTLRTSPLDALHRELGAKMVPFGGWDMPLQYPDGTLAEHRACRQRAVIFDVSHLGTVRVEGDGSMARLQDTLTNDLRKIGVGRAQYTHLLDPDDASVVDDIIVWWLDTETFDVMPNASNTERVVEAVGGADVTASRALLAVQGPAARDLLHDAVPGAADVDRFGVRLITWQGVTCTVAGTGYTGEDGVEIAVPRDVAPDMWRAVTGAGIPPAGLGARDTLRLEAGLPLHGHELGPGITPLQAGLGWVVGWDKETFRGRAALAVERDQGPARRLRGLQLEGRRPPRSGNQVMRGDRSVGEVTSGNFSPVLEHGIALALLEADIGVDSEVTVRIRDHDVPARVVPIPFVRPGQFALQA